jgi:hypothetical protein
MMEWGRNEEDAKIERAFTKFRSVRDNRTAVGVSLIVGLPPEYFLYASIARLTSAADVGQQGESQWIDTRSRGGS